MEQLYFERPREKLASKGAAHLSNIELLQIILGSGNAKASAARLAKRVAAVLSTENAPLEHLVGIDGIGFVKACQILAALELGARQSSRHIARADAFWDDEFAHSLSKTPVSQGGDVLVVCMRDGAGRRVFQKNYSLNRGRAALRLICEDALATQARIIQVAIHTESVGALASMPPRHLDMVKQLKLLLEGFELRLHGVYAVSRERVEKWRI